MKTFVLRTAPMLLLLLAAACAAPGRAQQDAPGSDEPLRVMSFNIRYNNPGDGAHAWPHRRDRAASIVRFHDADVVGLQEALKEQLDDLTARLPGYAVLGVGRDDGREAGEYTAILYRTDRLELLDHDTFWLSETPDVVASKSWDAAITRIATWARFRDRATGDAFVHVNTHFDHVGETARTESARLLADTVATIAGDAPYVVTGDFNFTPDAAGYGVLTDRLQDARLAAEEPAHGPPGTWSTFEVGAEPLDRRIDYVFAAPAVRVLAFGTLTDSWDGAYASDHLPVLAEITW